MYTQNQSTVTEFILLGLSMDPFIQVLLFHIFLVVYLSSLTGNLLLLLAVRTDKRLHTSMYFFLSSLSFVDICFTSSVVPKTLANFLSPKKSISFTGCAVHDTSAIKNLIRVFLPFMLFIPLSLILISYIRIITAIMKISLGRNKAFSTCISHLVVVVIFYGTSIFVYGKPENAVTEDTDKKVAVFYMVITPMINPLIYSLRNKDVQKAMKSLIRA
ncbi:hypothetical protein AB205_0208890, partial [Aquarana catesbeiana]